MSENKKPICTRPSRPSEEGVVSVILLFIILALIFKCQDNNNEKWDRVDKCVSNLRVGSRYVMMDSYSKDPFDNDTIEILDVKQNLDGDRFVLYFSSVEKGEKSMNARTFCYNMTERNLFKPLKK